MSSISITFELGKCLSQQLSSYIYHLCLRLDLIPGYPSFQGCTFSLGAGRKETLSWPSCFSNCIKWAVMVLQEECYGAAGLLNAETDMAVASACSVSPLLPCYMAQHLKGHESIKERCGGLELAMCRVTRKVPFLGMSILHATEKQWCWVPAWTLGPKCTGATTTMVGNTCQAAPHPLPLSYFLLLLFLHILAPRLLIPLD